MPHYYDNDPLYMASDEACEPVERVYCLQFSQFTSEHWTKLQGIYETLPGWVGIGTHGCPCWFGTSTTVPYLVASVEPSGLQVSGVLEPTLWTQWHSAFYPHVVEFPAFEA